MHPTLIRFGETGGLSTYGVLIAAAFLIGVVLGARVAQRQAIGVGNWLDLAFWVLVTSLLGSRLFFVITQADAYIRICAGGETTRTLGKVLFDCSRPLHVWEGGLVYYGGLLCGIATSIYFTRKRKIAFLRVADLAIPIVAFGHAIGRLGCFAAGCCYGKACAADSVLGVSFPAMSLAYQELKARAAIAVDATHTPLLHATQLYEAFGESLIFIFLLWLGQRRRYHGQTLLAYLTLYPILRAVIELYRADPGRRFIFTFDTPALSRWLGLPTGEPLLLSTSQGISVAVLMAAAILWWRLRKRRAAAA